ncbi:MAG TPA: rod shape-determining protein MreC [Terriglobales bacterium]|jgi:rod shape-determining protein MreC|nr:rod shape-determining protein MreC [Terriglobales bacterium]
METVLGRYRNLIVLVGVLFVQVLGLAVQVKRTSDSDSSRLIRVWAVGAISPLEKALVWTQNSSGNLWHNYLYLRGVRAENRDLKQQVEQMRIEQVRLSQDADQARRLQALLAFKEQFISKTMAAQVIGSTGSEQSRGVYLDKGEKDGIKPDMAVITADGVVGKVLRVYRSSSLVLLISDQTSGVGAILEKSRLQGILRGMPSGEVGVERVMSDEDVPAGEMVLTSGGDRIFPKGLVIGKVTQVTKGGDFFLNIRVSPSANLSKLEEVLIVTKIDERQAQPEPTGPSRAADILAERLPTVPPKAPDAAAAKPSGTAPQAGSAADGKPAPPKPKATAAAGGAVAPASRKVISPTPSGGTVAPGAGSDAATAPPKVTKPPADSTPQTPPQDPPQ